MKLGLGTCQMMFGLSEARSRKTPLRYLEYDGNAEGKGVGEECRTVCSMREVCLRGFQAITLQ